MAEELPLAERLVRVSFQDRRVRNAAGMPLVPPEYAADAGQRITVVDVREEADLTGPLGHIPGSVHVPLAQVARIPEALGTDHVVLLVSNHSDRSGRAALYLEALGMQAVAAMEGGMHAWKAMGLATSRTTLFRGRALRPLPPSPPPPPDGLLTRDLLEAHVARRGSVKWMKLAAFLMRGRRSCVDGRDDHGVIGTPGGDSGEFVLALAAYESLTGVALTQDHVDALFLAWTDTFGRFYMHNDTPTINKLVPRLREDVRLTRALEAVQEPIQWRAFLRGPPAAVHEPLLDHYCKDTAMGCGHLRLMAQNPQRYGVRDGLVSQVLRSFWTTRWKGAPEPEYVVLGGTHAEGAVVNVTLEEPLWTFSRIPLVSPNVDGVQMFINHPQVAHALRQNVAEFMLHAESMLPVVPRHREALVERVHQLGKQHLDATLGSLAKGLPVFEVRFGDHETFTVLEQAPANPAARART